MKTSYLAFVAFLFVISISSAALTLELDHIETDLVGGCQFYSVKSTDLTATTAAKPTSELVSSKVNVSKITPLDWEILTTSTKTREVWEPNIKCTNTTTGNGTVETCTDNGKYVSENYTASEYKPMKPSETFPNGKSSIRYCAKWPVTRTEKGWGMEADMIPTFNGVRYPAYAWWNTTWQNNSCVLVSNPNAAGNYTFNMTTQSTIGSEIRWTTANATGGNETEVGGFWKVLNTSGTTANLYVINASLANGTNSTQICYYYGNTSVVGSSTKDDSNLACNFFDNFPGTSLNTTTKWTINGGSPTVAGSILTVPVNAAISSQVSQTNKTVLMGYGVIDIESGTHLAVWGFGVQATAYQLTIASSETYGSSLNWTARSYAGADNYVALPAVANSSYNLFRVAYDNGRKQVWVNERYATGTTSIPAINMPIWMTTATAGANSTKWDWMCAYNDLSSYGYNVSFSAWTNDTSASTTISFTSPTPPNATNNFTYANTFNCTSTSALSEGNLIEFNGVNRSATLSSDNLSFTYQPTYAEHIYNSTMTAKCWGNVSGTYVQGNETRTVPYYGCGMVTASSSLISNVDITGSGKCFQINTSNIIFDGNGYSVDGDDTTGGGGGCSANYAGISIYGTSLDNITVQNFNIRDFDYTISIFPIAVTDSNFIVRNNSVSSSETSCMCMLGNNISIYNNTFDTCSESGIWGDNIATNTTIFNNTFTNISGSGFFDIVGANDITIWNNYFNGSILGSYIAVSGIYFNTTKTLGTNIIGGAYIGGNWYSDYTGVSYDGSGIGALTYATSPGTTDYLPLTYLSGVEPNITLNYPSNGTNITSSTVIFNWTTVGSDASYLSNITDVSMGVVCSDVLTINNTPTYCTVLGVPTGQYTWFVESWNDTTGSYNRSYNATFNVTENIVNITINYYNWSPYATYTTSWNTVTTADTGTFLISYIGAGASASMIGALQVIAGFLPIITIVLIGIGAYRYLFGNDGNA